MALRRAVHIWESIRAFHRKIGIKNTGTSTEEREKNVLNVLR